MSYEDIDDLMQEAYFGLMAAVRGYGLGEFPKRPRHRWHIRHFVP